MGEGCPGGTKYTFKGTLGARSEYDNGSITIYSVDEHESTSQDAIDVFTHLRHVSADHPALRSLFPMSRKLVDRISGPYGPQPVGAKHLCGAALDYVIRLEYI